MKGRRRARRLALECLYELDQSTHPLDLVVQHRALAVLEDVLGTLGDRVPKSLVAALAHPAARASLAEAAGAASALNGFLMMLVAFVMGGWLGRHMDGSVFPLTNGLWFWSAIIALSAWTLVQKHGDPTRAA